MAHNNKKSVTGNYKWLVLSDRDKTFHFLNGQMDLDREQKDGSIRDGDVIIELTTETVRVATLKYFIEIE